MKKTSAGIPNTCTMCGKPQAAAWYAKNEDEAIAGIGYCEQCNPAKEAAAEGKPEAAAPEAAEKPKTKRTRRRASKKKTAETTEE